MCRGEKNNTKEKDYEEVFGFSYGSIDDGKRVGVR